jgi:predicted nucleotidyltransferase component of viral defense system
MIPANVIKAWSNVVPWITDEQIEQDLVLSRALVEIFSNSSTNIQTYQLEEMIGTKLRAFNQRKYGRDLYDIYKALKSTSLDIDRVIHSYKEYMAFVVDNPPTQKQ